MNKNNLIYTAIICLTPSITMANDKYIGIGVQNIDLKYNNPNLVESNDYFEDTFTDFNILIGYKLDQNTSLELSYSSTKENKANNNTGFIFLSDSVPLTTQSDVDLSILSLDIINDYDYFYNNDLALFSLAGLSLVNIDVNEKYYGNGILRTETSDNEKKLGINIGGGIKYKINHELSLQLKVQYTHIDSLKFNSIEGIDQVESFISTGMGIKYLF
tara:strand:- start:1293 stop:1940 length:648 start_codon:yes stop_codon:yes gene_type:complete